MYYELREMKFELREMSFELREVNFIPLSHRKIRIVFLLNLLTYGK